MGNAGKMTAVFLQARIDSTRLPGKVLLPLAGRTIIDHVMEALKEIEAGRHVLLTDIESFADLEPHATECGFEIFRGPRDDVLSRYAGAISLYKPDYIIRATGDNPLVSSFLAREILSAHIASGAHYSGFSGAPLGTGVEVVDAPVLMRAAKEAKASYEREHVTPFIYRRPREFSIHRPSVPPEFYMPEARVTLDTEEDYRFICRIFSDIYTGRPVPADRLVQWLKSPAGRRAADSDRAVS